MSRPVKVALGMATLWPLVHMFIFLGFIFYLVLWGRSNPDSPDSRMPDGFVVLFVMHVITMVWIICLLIIYICNVFNNERVDKDKKVLWAIVLFFGGVIAMPIYWYLYIWPENDRPAQMAGPMAISEPEA